jgi:hypothetical protein
VYDMLVEVDQGMKGYSPPAAADAVGAVAGAARGPHAGLEALNQPEPVNCAKENRS